MLNKDAQVILKTKTQYDLTIESYTLQKFKAKNLLSIQTNNQNSQKPQLNEYKILQNLPSFKRSIFICRQDDMNSLFLFKQPSFFNA